MFEALPIPERFVFPVCPNHLQRHMDYALCNCNGKKIDWMAIGIKYANLYKGEYNGQTIQ